MPRRLITVIKPDGVTAREGHVAAIYLDRDFNEYQVELRIDGVPQPGATYYTDDRDDARATARVMVFEYAPQ